MVREQQFPIIIVNPSTPVGPDRCFKPLIISVWPLVEKSFRGVMLNRHTILPSCLAAIVDKITTILQAVGGCL